MDTDSIRARALVEESREAVVVLDDDRDGCFSRAGVHARASTAFAKATGCHPSSWRAARAFSPLSSRTRQTAAASGSCTSPREGDLAAYEELRSGFTAAVSHELRTPLARLLTLLETATLPGEDVTELVEQATREVEQITELIDEILFLSELESGARVVSLGPTPVRPVLEEALDELAERASRAGVDLRLDCDPDVELAIRPRMLRVLARNLAENAIRYAGPRDGLHASVPRERTTPPPSSRVAMTGSASRRPRSRGCSSVSTGLTALEHPAAPGSALRS